MGDSFNFYNSGELDPINNFFYMYWFRYGSKSTNPIYSMIDVSNAPTYE